MASSVSVVCAPTAAWAWLPSGPGNSSGLFGDPAGRSPPAKASMNAVMSATSCVLLTLKTGSAMKRSMESTLPSWR